MSLGLPGRRREVFVPQTCCVGGEEVISCFGAWLPHPTLPLPLWDGAPASASDTPQIPEPWDFALWWNCSGCPQQGHEASVSCLGWQLGASQTLKGHFYSFMFWFVGFFGFWRGGVGFVFGFFVVVFGFICLCICYVFVWSILVKDFSLSFLIPSDHRQGRSFPGGLGFDIGQLLEEQP